MVTRVKLFYSNEAVSHTYASLTKTWPMFKTYKKSPFKYWFQVNTLISEQDEQSSPCSSQRYKPFFFYFFEKGNKPKTAYWPHRKIIYVGRLLDPPGRSGNLLFYFIGLPPKPKLNRSKTTAKKFLTQMSLQKILNFNQNRKNCNTNLKAALTSFTSNSQRKHFNLWCASFRPSHMSSSNCADTE